MPFEDVPVFAAERLINDNVTMPFAVAVPVQETRTSLTVVVALPGNTIKSVALEAGVAILIVLEYVFRFCGIVSINDGANVPAIANVALPVDSAVIST